jgi:hypothetical protein
MTPRFLTVLLVLVCAAGDRLAAQQDDPGKARIGRVAVTVYHATDGDPSVAGGQAAAVEPAVEERLRGEQRLRFKHYRLLGSDTQTLYRSYENWAKPLPQSEEVLVRFEARSRPTREATRLDLELWLSRKKILKTDAVLMGERPLYILGPEWRGGRLIIAVALAPKPKPDS